MNLALPTGNGRKIKKGWMNLRVSKIVEDTHDTKTLYLVDADEGGRRFDYTAGQYLTFRFDTLAEKPVVRSYTLSSSPCQVDDVAFTVKEVDDGFVSKWLVRDAKVGDILRARGPIGKFCYDPNHDKKHLFMIAAGSGVTPFVAIMREYVQSSTDQKPDKMTILVTFKSMLDLILWDTLKPYILTPSTRVIVSLTREDNTAGGFLQGRISDSLLEHVIGNEIENTTFMTCGPDEMMNLVKRHLMDKGVAEDHVKMESFSS